MEKPQTGKLRVCLDPKDLNKAIKRPHYPLPNLNDITAKLAEACYFSVMDARSRYWAIKLTEESSKSTTIKTVFGRNRFLRQHFGLTSAQDVFRQRVDETCEGLQGVTTTVVDVLICGQSREEHDKNLCARERGVTQHREKNSLWHPSQLFWLHHNKRWNQAQSSENYSCERHGAMVNATRRQERHEIRERDVFTSLSTVTCNLWSGL